MLIGYFGGIEYFVIMIMSKRLDTALRYLIIIYGAICIYNYFNFPIDASVPLISILADGVDIAIGHYSKGYQWILLALLIVFRFVLFGKTYQK